MHPISSTGAIRYIIRSEDGTQMIELIRRFEADPAIELVDVIGPDDTPHTVVARMAPEMAAALALQFSTSNQFTIEPDRPLSLFGSA